jgi:signal transduction histidine kinase
VAIAHLALILSALLVRGLAPESHATTALVWAAALALPALAISFGVGLIRQRLVVADAVGGLGQRIRDGLPARDLGGALSTALDDPSLRLIYPAPRNVPDPGPGRHATEVQIGDRVAALVVHDDSLLGQPRLLGTVVTLVRMALENERLSGQVAASLAEIAASRGRIQAAADNERRRIERDLHDGAQQRLVALRVKLALTEEMVREDPELGLPRLHSLGDEVTATLEEIRSLARGVYPALLADRGLPDALRAAARSSAGTIRVEPDGIGRYAQEVESAVYFSCLEALQNVGKHAPGATVTIQLREDDRLRFEVRDDGVGFDVEEDGEGAGLTNMRDRIEAVGGRLSIRSASGRGSVVSGSVPLV